VVALRGKKLTAFRQTQERNPAIASGCLVAPWQSRRLVILRARAESLNAVFHFAVVVLSWQWSSLRGRFVARGNPETDKAFVFAVAVVVDRVIHKKAIHLYIGIWLFCFL
jgi:hypothetical protein